MPEKSEANGSGTDPQRRAVHLSRVGEKRFKATNDRGGVVVLGQGEDPDFTPVELLLAAMAGCSAIDVDFITGKRSPAVTFDVEAQGSKVRDEHGNHLEDLRVTFSITFPDGAEGDAARAVLDRAIAQSRDRLCTVSRTVALPNEVRMNQAGKPDAVSG